MEFDERRYRPLSTVDLYDEAFDLYKRNFVLFLSIVAFVVIPSDVLWDVFATKWLKTVLGQIGANASASYDPSNGMQLLAEMFKQASIAAIIYIPVLTLVCAATTVAASSRYLEKPITLGQAYTTGIRKFLPCLVATVVFLFLSFIGTAIMSLGALYPDLAGLFIFIGFFVGTALSLFAASRYTLYMGAAIGENLGPVAALKRSVALTKTDAGRVVGAVICLFVIMSVIYIAINGIVALFTGGVVSSAYFTIPALEQNKFLATQIADGLTNLLLTPFAIIVLTLLYYDQRIRKEGFDMEVLAERLGYQAIAPSKNAAYSPALTVAVKRGRK
jgi:hypothetical protein